MQQTNPFTAIASTVYQHAASRTRQPCAVTSVLQQRHLVYPCTALLTTAIRQPRLKAALIAGLLHCRQETKVHDVAHPK